MALAVASVVMGGVSLALRKTSGLVWGVAFAFIAVRFTFGLGVARVDASWLFAVLGGSLSLLGSAALALGAYLHLGQKLPRLFYPTIALCLLWLACASFLGFPRTLGSALPIACAAFWLAHSAFQAAGSKLKGARLLSAALFVCGLRALLPYLFKLAQPTPLTVIVLEVCVWGFAAFAVAFALIAAQTCELEGERLVSRTLGEASASAGGEGVLIVDRAGVVVHASAAAQKLLERSLLSLVGGRAKKMLERVEGVYVTSRPLPGAGAHAFGGSSTAAGSALGEVLFLSADASSPVRDRYRALVGALSEGWLAVESFTGRILAANASAAGLFSLSEAELLERDLWTLAVPGEGGALRTRLVEAVGATAGRFESGLERRGGIRFEAQLAVSEIDWDGTAAWQVLVADRSAEKRGERLETSGALAAGMAHDLKNVLQTILTATGSSALSAPESRVIAAAARKGDRMVRQILSGARFDGNGGAGRAAGPVALAQLVSSVVAEARRHFGDALELSLNFTSSAAAATTAATTIERLEVPGDAHQLEQALTNLLLNARDAVGGRGRIAVELACSEQGALIAVDDDGPGLNEGERERVFAPYYTTKGGGAKPVDGIVMQGVAQSVAQDIVQDGGGRGTGLGLPMVRAIVENHGGAVKVGAGTLGGARFELILPLYKPRKAVLIIDPDEGFRFEAGRALKLSGWEVHTASTPERGVELARHHAEWLEVVLVDLVQNGMGGRACLEAVAGAAPKAKVVVASSVTSEATLKGAVAAGAFKALAKPIDPPELVAVLSGLG